MNLISFFLFIVWSKMIGRSCSCSTKTKREVKRMQWTSLFENDVPEALSNN